ncbi:MAG: HipA family kinase, partial [Chloroflexaceae bacterium]
PGKRAAFDALNAASITPELAARIVWFDAFVTNVDRTALNTNLLLWHRQLYLIDHGAALIVHHTWEDWRARAGGRFTAIRNHVLLPVAGDLRAADAALAPRITPTLVERLVAAVPDVWLTGDSPFESLEEHRAAYVEYLLARAAPPRLFVEEAIHARNQRL